MISSTYIVIIYLTGDQVLVCKHCYYFIHAKNCFCHNFFCRNKGYVIPKDIILCYLFDVVHLNTMLLI